MLASFVPVGILFLIAAGFAALVLWLTSFMGPKGLSPGAEETYESGIVPEEPAIRRFPVRFALIAMLFLVFDIEAVFFYPWAVVLHQLRWYGVIEMFVFIGVLLVALGYIWNRGGLEWE